MMRRNGLLLFRKHVVPASSMASSSSSMVQQHPLEQMSPAVTKFACVLEDYRRKKYVASVSVRRDSLRFFYAWFLGCLGRNRYEITAC